MYDANAKFSASQAITASAASTNNLDANADIGHGNINFLDISVIESFDNLTSLQVGLRESSDNVTFTDVLLTAPILLAELVAGYRFKLDKIPHLTKQYLQIYYTVVGTAPTAGKVFAAVTPTIQDSFNASKMVGGNSTY